MGKKNRSKTPITENPLLDSTLVKLIGIVTLVYILLWAFFCTLLGKESATLITTPLWGISLFILGKWDLTRPSKENLGIEQLIYLPVLNYWNIVWIVLTILVSNSIFSFIIFFYLDKTNAELVSSADSIERFFSALTNTEASIAFLVTTYLSHSIGGFVSVWLPNKKRVSPYSHAIIGSLIYVTLNILLVIFAVNSDEDFDKEIGAVILGLGSTFLFTIAGVWVAFGIKGSKSESERKNSDKLKESSKGINETGDSSYHLARRPSGNRKKRRGATRAENKTLTDKNPSFVDSDQEKPLVFDPQDAKTRFYRGIAVLCIGAILSVFTGFVVWIIRLPEPAECPNPPTVATLNYWPVTYSSPAEFCHDYSTIDARLVGEGEHYSLNQQDWENGLIAHTGDEINGLIFINNGAASNAENLNPGQGIAQNIHITTEINSRAEAVHYIKVWIAGDNTNKVFSAFKITTSDSERLEVIPKSGEIFSYDTKTRIRNNLDVGNNVTILESLPPRWTDSVFVRFRLKVSSP